MNNSLKVFIKNKLPDIENEELINFVSLWKFNRTLKKNEILNSSGVIKTNLYYIEEGSLKICYEDYHQEIIVEFGYKNNCIFDLVSFITDKPSRFYFQALKSTKLIGISKHDFNSALDKSATLNNFWRKHYEELLLNFVNREIDILINSPEMRYKRLLERRPELFQNIPHKYIAIYLGMSPETFSRLQKS